MTKKKILSLKSNNNSTSGSQSGRRAKIPLNTTPKSKSANKSSPNSRTQLNQSQYRKTRHNKSEKSPEQENIAIEIATEGGKSKKLCKNENVQKSKTNLKKVDQTQLSLETGKAKKSGISVREVYQQQSRSNSKNKKKMEIISNAKKKDKLDNEGYKNFPLKNKNKSVDTPSKLNKNIKTNSDDNKLKKVTIGSRRNALKSEDEVKVEIENLNKSSQKKIKTIKKSEPEIKIEVVPNTNSNTNESSKKPKRSQAQIQAAPNLKRTAKDNNDKEGEDLKVAHDNISIEIDNIIKRLETNRKRNSEIILRKKSTSIKSRKHHTAFEEKLETYSAQNIRQIVNIKEINSKLEIKNSDLILSILEIAINSTKYGIDFLNRSKFFWEAVSRHDDFKNIVNQFKPETLRKYWRIICRIDNHEKIIDTVRKFKNSIDESELRLLTTIYIIINYLKEGSLGDLEKELKNYQVTQTNTSKYRMIEEEVQVIEKDGTMLNKKRKRVSSPLTKIFDGSNPQGILTDKPWAPIKKAELEKKAKLENRKKFIKKSDIKKRDERYKFDQKRVKNSTIKKLHEEFPKFTVETIHEFLFNHSNNIGLTKEYMKTLKPSIKRFTNLEDNIIRCHRNTKLYKELITRIGKNNVEEREEFLNIK